MILLKRDAGLFRDQEARRRGGIVKVFEANMNSRASRSSGAVFVRPFQCRTINKMSVSGSVRSFWSIGESRSFGTATE